MTEIVGKLEVVVEMPEKNRITFQSESHARAATLAQFYSRLTGIANQLGLQGRLIRDLQLAPALTPYRQTGVVTFQEVSNGQLKTIRRTAQQQAREQLRESDGDNGASQLDPSPHAEAQQEEGASEPEGSRESRDCDRHESLLVFPGQPRPRGDSA